MESLDKELNNTDEITLLDSIEDDTFSYDDVIYQEDLKRLRIDLRAFLDDVLDEESSEIIRLRYGIGEKALDRSSIAKKYNCEITRIRGIEERALRTLRRYSWKINKIYPGIKSYMVEHMDSTSLGRNRELMRITILDWIRSNEYKYIYIHGHKYEIIDANKFYVSFSDNYGCINYIELSRLRDYIKRVDGIELIFKDTR